MSHIVEIQTQVRDSAAVALACRRLGLAPPVAGSTRLYSGTVHGLAVQLTGWTYPVVCDLASGQLQYDNFQGRWGAETEIHRFLQAYAVEKAKLEARRQGHAVTERSLADGSIQLTVQVGGAP